MSVLETIPLTDIRFDDIRDTLNSYGGSVTNQLKTAFIDSAKYNKWARWKPRIYPADFVPMGNPSISPQSWRSTDGWCGLTLPVCYNLQDVIGKDFEEEWKRNPPTGGSSAPIRKDDYGGYNPKASNPISTFMKDGAWKDIFYIEDSSVFMTGIRCFFNDNRIGKGNDSSLDLTDFAFRGGYTNMTDGYFGLIISKKDSTFCSWITTEKKLGDIISLGPESPNQYPYFGGLGIYFNLDSRSFEMGNQSNDEYVSYAGDGEYNIYSAIFIDRNAESNGIIRGTTNNKTLSNGFIPLPVPPVTVNVIRKSALVEFQPLSATVRNASQSMGGGDVYVSFKIYNNSNDDGVIVLLQGGSSNNHYKVGVRRYWNDGSHEGTSYVTSTQQDNTPITIPAKSYIQIDNFYIGWVSGAYDSTSGDECKLEIDFGGYWGGSILYGHSVLDRKNISIYNN